MTKQLFPYQQVRKHVLERISDGSWVPGELIPAEVKLAAELSVHRLTVNRVLTELAREGLLLRRRGAGTVLLRKSRPDPGEGRKLVGLITGHHFDPATNPFFGVIFERLRKALKAQGIFLLPMGDAHEVFGGGTQGMVVHRDLAALAMLGGPEGRETTRRLEECGYPAMIIGVSEYEGPLPHVETADEADAGTVARKLLALGHRQIVHINATPPMRIRTRLQGFLHACEEHGHALPFRYIVDAKGLEIRDGKEAMLGFLKLGLPFTAVFGAIDNLALGAMAALVESGIDVPGQVSVAGFDGIDAALHSIPLLSTMKVSRSSLAEQAAQCLVEMCAGRPCPKPSRQPHAKWIEGATVAPAAGGVTEKRVGAKA